VKKEPVMEKCLKTVRKMFVQGKGLGGCKGYCKMQRVGPSACGG